MSWIGIPRFPAQSLPSDFQVLTPKENQSKKSGFTGLPPELPVEKGHQGKYGTFVHTRPPISET